MGEKWTVQDWEQLANLGFALRGRGDAPSQHPFYEIKAFVRGDRRRLRAGLRIYPTIGLWTWGRHKLPGKFKHSVERGEDLSFERFEALWKLWKIEQDRYDREP